ncbi:hypothetical protein E4U54_004902, partial [Claviceps lovelessii]
MAPSQATFTGLHNFPNPMPDHLVYFALDREALNAFPHIKSEGAGNRLFGSDVDRRRNKSLKLATREHPPRRSDALFKEASRKPEKEATRL